MLVLDEADEMFSMGFAKELNSIMDALPSQLQYLCFSATIDNNVQRIAERRMHEPQFIALSSDQVGAAEISHYLLSRDGRQDVRARAHPRGRES